MRKTGADGTVNFIYDEAGHLVGEFNGSNALIQETAWLDDTPIALLTGTSTIQYIHADHLNTPRVITSTAGTMLWWWNADAFGDYTANEDVDGNGTKVTYNPRFPGQYYDVTVKSNYNYFRDYDPMTGRYLQSDPIGLAGGLNTYAYVGGNPLRFVDPYGLDATATLGRGLVFFGGAAAADGPSPIGDAIGAAGFLGFSAYAAYEALSDGPSEQATENTEACPGNGDKWKCEGYGQYEIIGQNKHVVRGPWFVAYGLTEPDAAYNWKKAVQAAAPPGHTARHIRPKRCTKIK